MIEHFDDGLERLPIEGIPPELAAEQAGARHSQGSTCCPTRCDEPAPMQVVTPAPACACHKPTPRVRVQKRTPAKTCSAWALIGAAFVGACTAIAIAATTNESDYPEELR